MGKSTKKEADVLVVGGGPGGIAAALSAARLGAKTLIIEQFNCLGGVATAGGHGEISMYTSWGTEERIVGGIPFEIAQRIEKAGYGEYRDSDLFFELEGMKLVLEQMAEEAGVDLLYHTFFSDTIVEDGKVTGVVVQNKGGQQRIIAKRVIDCTGDGDAAARAGCAFDMGDEETGHCQPVTLMFTIGGVDWQKASEFQRKSKDGKLEEVWKKAQENGDMRPFQTCIMGWIWTPTRPDQVGVNFTHVNFIDSTKAEDLTKATIEARKQAFETIKVYRKYVPGMENCYMIATPNTVGLRESRRIRGEYTLTKEDVISEKTFEDSIGYGCFFIDIHGTTGPGMDKREWKPPRQGFKYQIPYRILVPKDVDNLLVAGRCVSCTHEALGSLRVMVQCAVMGQAAGTAAGISLDDSLTPREVDVKKLQESLRRQGCILDEEAASEHHGRRAAAGGTLAPDRIRAEGVLSSGFEVGDDSSCREEIR